GAGRGVGARLVRLRGAAGRHGERGGEQQHGRAESDAGQPDAGHLAAIGGLPETLKPRAAVVLHAFTPALKRAVTRDDHCVEGPLRMSSRTRPTHRRLPESPVESGRTLSSVPLQEDVRQRWAQPGLTPTDPGAEPGEGALGSYLRAVRAHLVLVIAITVAAGVAALAWGQLRTATYEATAEMLVTPISSDDSTYLGLPLVRDTGDPPRTLQTAATLIDSPRAAQLAARRLGHGWTQRKVENAVDVTPEGQSSIVDITASDTSANGSAHVANVFVKAVTDARKATLAPLV